MSEDSNDAYLKPIKRAIVLYGESLGVIHREEVAILTELISNVNRLYYQKIIKTVVLHFKSPIACQAFKLAEM